MTKLIKTTDDANRFKKVRRRGSVSKMGVGKYITVVAKVLSLVAIGVYFFFKFWFVVVKAQTPVGWFSVDEALGLLYTIIILQLIVLPIDISIIIRNFFSYRSLPSEIINAFKKGGRDGA